LRVVTKIRLAVLSVILLILAVAFASLWTIHSVTEADQGVSHANEVLDELDAIFSNIKDVNSGARGYVLTGNKGYLQAYSLALDQIEPHLQTLHGLLADNSDEQARADDLRALLEQVIQIQKHIVAGRAEGEEMAQIVSLMDHGKEIMDRVRNLVARMKSVETRLLGERMAATHRNSREAEVAILVMVLLVLLLLAGAYSVSQRERRARDESAKVLHQSEEKVRLLLSSTAEGIYSIDLQGLCTGSNPACIRLLGYQEERQLLGKNVHELVHHTRVDGTPLPAEECRIYQALRQGTGTHSDEEVLWRADGTSFPAEYWSHPIFREGAITGAVVTILNISKRKKAEEDSRKANEMLANLVQELDRNTAELSKLSQLGSMLQSCLTLDEAYRVITRSAADLFPEESGSVFEITSSRDTLEGVVAWGPSAVGERTFVQDDCWALRTGQPHCVDGINFAMACRHMGDAPGVAYLCYPMMAQGEAMGLLHLQVKVRSEMSGSVHFKRSKIQLVGSVAEHIAPAFASLKLRDALRAQSIRDALTGLYNRRFMEETLEKELKRGARNTRTVCVILLDVDHFKRYNDTYGHEAGDAVLRELGIFLKAQIRGDDIACRYGGEEFILIMPEASLDVAIQRAEKLRQGVKRLQITSQGQSLGVISISLGVASFPTHGALSDVLLRSADSALYEAKENGRDRVVVAKAVLEDAGQTDNPERA